MAKSDPHGSSGKGRVGACGRIDVGSIREWIQSLPFKPVKLEVRLPKRQVDQAYKLEPPKVNSTDSSPAAGEK